MGYVLCAIVKRNPLLTCFCFATLLELVGMVHLWLFILLILLTHQCSNG